MILLQVAMSFLPFKDHSYRMYLLEYHVRCVPNYITCPKRCSHWIENDFFERYSQIPIFTTDFSRNCMNVAFRSRSQFIENLPRIKRVVLD